MEQEAKNLPAIHSETQLPTCSAAVIDDFRDIDWNEKNAREAAEALPKYEAALAPLPRDEIRKLFLFYFTPFKVPDLSEAEYRALVKIHLDNFAEFPADLVELSLRHIAQNFRYGTPRPGDYRSCILDEWESRAHRRDRLVFFLKRWEEEEKPRIEREKKEREERERERAERESCFSEKLSRFKKEHKRDPSGLDKIDIDFEVDKELYGEETAKFRRGAALRRFGEKQPKEHTLKETGILG